MNVHIQQEKRCFWPDVNSNLKPSTQLCCGKRLRAVIHDGKDEPDSAYSPKKLGSGDLRVV
jgi:hypothetical protein